MATIVNNKKVFKVIKMSNEEAKSIGFGTPYGCICSECNEIINDDIYYIAVLNVTMDKKCYEEWLGWAINYPEDKEIEEKEFNTIKNKLNI